MIGVASISSNESRWYAVNTQPHMERRAEANLSFQGFEVAHLKRRKTIRHARRFQTVLAPVFPGYIFVRLNLSTHRWRSINGSKGVRSLIMAGDKPLAAPNGAVETLIEIHQANGQWWNKDLRMGNRVRLLEGPFAEMVGVLELLDDAGRVRVLLELLGTEVPVCTTANGVVPA